jgi:hypothetical protein
MQHFRTLAGRSACATTGQRGGGGCGCGAGEPGRRQTYPHSKHAYTGDDCTVVSNGNRWVRVERHCGHGRASEGAFMDLEPC